MDGEQFKPRLKAAVAEEVRVMLARRRLSGVQLAKLMGVTQAYDVARLGNEDDGSDWLDHDGDPPLNC